VTLASVIYLLWLAAPLAPEGVALPKVSWSSDLKLASLAAIDEAMGQNLREPVTVILEDQSTRSLKTCGDVLAVAKVKFDLPPDHQSDVDWNSLTSTSIRCFALDVLKSAKPASATHLAWFRFSQAGVAKLPPGLTLSVAEGEEKAIAKAEKNCKGWGKYDPELKLHVDGTDDGQLQAGGWAGRLTLYGRGDLDGDGLEDLLLYRYGKVDGGSASDESLFIVSQTSNKGCPRIVKTIPRSLGSGAHP
jgi:hypothetical protein